MDFGSFGRSSVDAATADLSSAAAARPPAFAASIVVAGAGGAGGGELVAESVRNGAEVRDARSSCDQLAKRGEAS